MNRLPLGDLAHNPGMSPEKESNQWPFGSQASAQSTEPHQPGQKWTILFDQRERRRRTFWEFPGSCLLRAMGEGITSAGKGIATSMVEVLSLDGRSRQLAWGTAAVGLVLGVHQLGSSALTAPIVGNCTHTSEGLLAHRPGLLGCYQTFKVEISPLLLKLFQNIEEKETLSNPFYKASITLISKADENTTKKANDRPVFFINVDAKILNKMLSTRIQQ